MGFVEAVREIIEKLRKTGKTKEEIFEVVKEAADKATIKAEDKGKEERAKQKSRIDGIDAMTYALQKSRNRRAGCRESNREDEQSVLSEIDKQLEEDARITYETEEWEEEKEWKRKKSRQSSKRH